MFLSNQVGNTNLDPYFVGLKISIISGGGRARHQDQHGRQGDRNERGGLLQDSGGDGTAERRVLGARRPPWNRPLAANW